MPNISISASIFLAVMCTSWFVLQIFCVDYVGACYPKSDSVPSKFGCAYSNQLHSSFAYRARSKVVCPFFEECSIRVLYLDMKVTGSVQSVYPFTDLDMIRA